MAVLLDTSVLIDILRGRPAAVERLRSVGRREAIYVCAISIEELYRGLRRGEEQATAALVRGLRLAPLARQEAVLAGTWRRDYAAEGVTLTQADCLIAASCRSAAARLATGNPRHFPMLEHELEHWQSGH